MSNKMKEIESDNDIVGKIINKLIKNMKHEIQSHYPNGLNKGAAINYLVSIGSSFLGTALLEAKELLHDPKDVNFAEVIMTIMTDLYRQIIGTSMVKTSQVFSS